MEGFNPLKFKWMLGERLASKNIDPRGVSGVEMIRDIEFLQWRLTVTYRLQLPDGPREWAIQKLITDGEAEDIEDIQEWMDDETKVLAIEFQRVLIPNRHDWFIYLTELLEQVQEEERR